MLSNLTLGWIVLLLANFETIYNIIVTRFGMGKYRIKLIDNENDGYLVKWYILSFVIACILVMKFISNSNLYTNGAAFFFDCGVIIILLFYSIVIFDAYNLYTDWKSPFVAKYTFIASCVLAALILLIQ